MFIHVGLRRFRARAIAFRKDYCLSCAREGFSARVRSLDFVTLFGLPVLPLGARRRWVCRACGKPPHDVPYTRLGYRIAGSLVLGLLALMSWVADPGSGADARRDGWLLRLGLTGGAALLALWASRCPRAVPLRTRLESLLPFLDVRCPLCGDLLTATAGLSCRSCNARHEPLAQS